MKRFILIALILAAVVGTYVWFFVYNKSHTNYQEETAAFVGTAIELNTKARENPTAFMEEYRNQAVEISGVVQESANSSYILETGVSCAVAEGNENDIPTTGENVTVKGRVVGTEEDILTGDVNAKLDQCVVKK